MDAPLVFYNAIAGKIGKFPFVGIFLHRMWNACRFTVAFQRSRRYAPACEEADSHLRFALREKNLWPSYI